MNQDLINEIQVVLSQLRARAPILQNPTAPDKLFEIYIMTCLLRALRDIGADIEIRDCNDLQSNVLACRLGHGLIYAPTTTPGFIYVNYNNKEYEIHNGLRARGRSGVLHELDVCMLDRDEAIRCRTKREHPTQGKIRFLAECKFYGAALHLSLGREFLGLNSEFSLRVKTIISNKHSQEIQKLVTRHRSTVNFEITPLNAQNQTRFIQWLANELKQVL